MKKLTQEEVIKKFKEKHGDKYDYSQVVYSGMNVPVTIICPIHGPFPLRPSSHINGTGCQECVRKKWTTELFIEEAKRVHGDDYDYSETEYKGTRVPVCIISHKKDKNGNEIGRIWQYPMSHLKSKGCHKEHYGHRKEEAWETRICPVCGTEFTVRKKYKKICCSEECRKIYCFEHKDEINKKRSLSVKKALAQKTDEEKKKSVEKRKKTCIAKYGKENFSQTEAGRKLCSQNMKSTKAERDKKYRENVLLPKYREICEKDDLELLEFRSRFDCDVRCKKCGNVFNTKILGYLTPKTNTNLCRFCHPIETVTGPTDFENTFENFIKTLGLKYTKNCRSVIYPKEIDFYFSDKKIGFELDGLYWHCETSKSNTYHLEKTEDAEKKGVKLIHIFEDEWRDKQDICKSRVKNILGVGIKRVAARKCKIKKVCSKDERDFLNENHIQGYCASKFCYGLFHDGELVSVMSFCPLRKNLGRNNVNGNFELLRFCNKNGITVQGGASKLFKHFIKEIGPNEVISYADRRWSSGNMYEKIGFDFIHDTKPNYFYLLRGERKNRFGFRKNILVEKYGCSKEESEHEFCLKNHWYRIYDCGSKFYRWTH